MSNAEIEKSIEYYRTRSITELFADALNEKYGDIDGWTAVAELHIRGTPESFDIAKQWCNAPEPKKRVVGLSVLSQLGNSRESPKGIFFDERVTIALKHLSEDDPDVLRAAVYALAHFSNNQSEKAASELIKLVGNKDAAIRHAIAFGLGGQSGRGDAIKALITLMDDDDQDVRNWATFSLGFETTGDSAEIREALRKRLTDPFEDARMEAVWALANRKDPQGLQILIERLEKDTWADGDRMAAADVLGTRYSDETPIEELCADLRKVLNESGK